jgi:hypothetical protein
MRKWKLSFSPFNFFFISSSHSSVNLHQNDKAHALDYAFYEPVTNISILLCRLFTCFWQGFPGIKESNLLWCRVLIFGIKNLESEALLTFFLHILSHLGKWEDKLQFFISIHAHMTMKMRMNKEKGEKSTVCCLHRGMSTSLDFTSAFVVSNSNSK